jgi:hypothetical protein
MKIIGCGEFPFLLILPLLNSLLSFSNFELYRNTEYGKHPIVDCLLSNILLCLSTIPFLVLELCFKRREKDSSRKHHKSSLIIQIKNPIIFMGVVAILFESINLIHSIFSNKLAFKTKIFMNDYVFELIFIVIASKLLEKNLIYRHHLVSIIFVFILGTLFYIIDLYNNNYRFLLIALILKQILFGTCIIFIKHFTTMKNYSIFRLIIIFSFIGLILDIFVLIITSQIHCTNSLCNSFYQKTGEKCEIIESNPSNNTNVNSTFIGDFKEIIEIINFNDINNTDSDIDNKNLTNNNCLYLDHLKSFINDFKNRYNGHTGYPGPYGKKFMIINIIYRVFFIFESYFLIIIIDKLRPSYTYFTSVLLTIFSKTKDLIILDVDGNKKFLIFIQIIITLFVLFWASIYNEIIELKFCGLDEDTRKNKNRRDDIDEMRKSDWLMNKVESDADATLAEDFNNSNSVNNTDNSNNNSVGTIVTMANYMK